MLLKEIKAKNSYKINLATFKQYLIFLGVPYEVREDSIKAFCNSENKVDDNYCRDVTDFNELQNIGEWYNTLPKSSKRLIKFLNDILLYIDNFNENENINERTYFIQAFEAILKTATNLDLISGKNSDNYRLYHDRLNYILLLILINIIDILNTDPNIISLLVDYIKKPDVNKFKSIQFQTKCKYGKLLRILTISICEPQFYGEDIFKDLYPLINESDYSNDESKTYPTPLDFQALDRMSSNALSKNSTPATNSKPDIPLFPKNIPTIDEISGMPIHPTTEEDKIKAIRYNLKGLKKTKRLSPHTYPKRFI